MRSAVRRRALALLAGGAALMAVPWTRAARRPPRAIKIVARRFNFTPSEIALKAGERVVLLISSIDFIHGFNVPELGLRADLVPGRVTRLEIQPRQPGKIDFLCDNFCGVEHEEMNGRFIVNE